MATQAIAGSVDKVLTNGFPTALKEVGMGVYNANPTIALIQKNRSTWQGESQQGGVVTSTAYTDKAQSYQNDDPVDTSSVEPVTAIQFELGGYQSSVNISGMKIRKVQTSLQKIMDLQKLETALCLKGMVERMAIHFFQATNDAKGIISLSTISDATTTIAGLAGSSTWGGTTTAAGAAFSVVGKNDLMTLYNTLSVNDNSLEESNGTTGFSNEPDTHITRRQEQQLYWATLEPSMRYEVNGTGDVKLKIAFMGSPVTVDQHCASGVWHMFKRNAIKWKVMSGADFTPLPVATTSTQPDMWARGVIWNGQVVFTSRRPFGKYTGIS